MNFFLLLNTKEDVLKKVITGQLLVPSDFHSRKNMEGNGC